MAQFETWLECDLKKPLKGRTLEGELFSQDLRANLVGVKVYDGGEPADLTGSAVTGYVIKDGGETVIFSGSLRGANLPCVVLPSNAYDEPGPIDIVIKVGAGAGEAQTLTTVGVCRAYVRRTGSDSAVTPEYKILDVNAILDMLETVETAASAANAAAADANGAAAKLEGMTATASAVSPGTANIKPAVTTTGGHYNIAFKVPKGDTGENASVTDTETRFQNSDSGTEVPDGEWLSAQPATPQGSFLWTRTALTWNNGQTTALYTVSRQGRDGTGSVNSVGGIDPDANGDVPLTAMTEAEIEALTDGSAAEAGGEAE